VGHMSHKEWIKGLLNSSDIGFVVVDAQYRVCEWNPFMAYHTRVPAAKALNRDLFDLFPSSPKSTIENFVVRTLNGDSRATSLWEEKRFLFRLPSAAADRSVTEVMYQNVSFSPVLTGDGLAHRVAITIYDVTHIATQRESLARSEVRANQLEGRDSLTGLIESNLWFETLASEMGRNRRYSQSSTLLLLDIDSLRQINRHFGHATGNEVVRRVGQLMQDRLRRCDYLCRLRGGRFAVMLPETNLRGAQILASRFQRSIDEQIVNAGTERVRFSACQGIASLNRFTREPEDWLSQAEGALNIAKRRGNNQVEVAPVS